MTKRICNRFCRELRPKQEREKRGCLITKTKGKFPTFRSSTLLKIQRYFLIIVRCAKTVIFSAVLQVREILKK